MSKKTGLGDKNKEGKKPGWRDRNKGEKKRAGGIKQRRKKSSTLLFYNGNHVIKLSFTKIEFEEETFSGRV